MSIIYLNPTDSITIFSNRSSENNLNTRVLFVGANTRGDISRCLLRFDLSSVSSDVDIKKASIKLYAAHSKRYYQEADITPFMIATKWQPEKVKWVSQPCISEQYFGETLTVNYMGWYKFDVTNIVREWVCNKKNNYGIEMRTFEFFCDRRKFYSTKFEAGRYQPILEIEYEVKKKEVELHSRKTITICQTYKTQDQIIGSEWMRTAEYSMYTFFVYNSGNYPAVVSLEVSPDQIHGVIKKTWITVLPGETKEIIADIFGYFTRVIYKSEAKEQGTILKIWYQAQI